MNINAKKEFKKRTKKNSMKNLKLANLLEVIASLFIFSSEL